MGESSVFCHFTQFNRRTVNGPFLSGAGINQEVSGGHWIWAVVLFTDDWLASQNHQIHLPTVTFITVIFKVTATCLVSQHWPPHIYSHLLSPPPFLSFSPLCICLPLSLCRWVFGQSLFCCFFTPPHPHPSPSFNYFYLTFFPSLLCPPPPPPSLTPPPELVLHVLSLSLWLCWAGGGEAGSGRCGERQGREGEKIRPPPLPLSEGCVLNPYIAGSPEMARNSFCTVSPRCLTLEEEFLHSQAQNECKWNSCGSECVGHSCVYVAALSRRHLKKKNRQGDINVGGRGVLKMCIWGPECNNMLLGRGVRRLSWGRNLFWSLSVRFLIISCLRLLTGCVQNKSLHQIIIVQSFKMAAELCLPNGLHTHVCVWVSVYEARL